MKEIVNLLDLYKSSVFERDFEKHINIYDTDIKSYDIWDKWSHDGIDAWRDMTRGWFEALKNQNIRDKVDFSDVKIVENDSLGFLSATVTFTAVDKEGSELKSLQNRLTWVLEKKDENWRVIHQHTSAPVNCSTMEVYLKSVDCI